MTIGETKWLLKTVCIKYSLEILGYNLLWLKTLSHSSKHNTTLEAKWSFLLINSFKIYKKELLGTSLEWSYSWLDKTKFVPLRNREIKIYLKEILKRLAALLPSSEQLLTLVVPGESAWQRSKRNLITRLVAAKIRTLSLMAPLEFMFRICSKMLKALRP